MYLKIIKVTINTQEKESHKTQTPLCQKHSKTQSNHVKMRNQTAHQKILWITEKQDVRMIV